MCNHGRATTAALAASIGAFLFGLDIGYIAPILECPSFKRDVGHLPDWADPASKISPAAAGFIVAVFSIGCIATSFPPVSSYFLDELGRRSSIVLGGVVFLVGCFLQANSTSLTVFLVGRLVTGTAIGLLSNVVPLYQAEMAPPQLRGTLTSMYNMMITTGIFVAALADQFLVDLDGGWQTAIMMQAVPATFILAVMPFLPRSPRWLVQQRRQAEAEQTLLELRSGPRGEGEVQAREELAEIVAEVEAEDLDGKKRWGDVFSGRVGALVAIGALLQFFQQLVGMNAFMYFGPRIFKSFDVNPNAFQTMANAVNMICTVPALYFIEKAGRRALLIAGAAGMAISCFLLWLLGGRFMIGDGEELVPSSHLVGWVMEAQAMVFSFIGCFACTWGPVVWVYCAEIFPLKHRARCIGVTTTTNWVGNFLIAQFTPMLLSSIGFGTFLVFGVCCGLALLLALWLPETGSVPLEQVGHLFDERFARLGIEEKAMEGPCGKESMEAGYGTMTEGKTI